MENFPKITYKGLLREENAKFATRHLAENFDEAFFKYNLKYRRNIYRQTFFIAKLDTEFYVHNGYIISMDKLDKIDITEDYDKMRWGTHCIWQNDHYDRHLWYCFNFHHQKKTPLLERIKKLNQCHKCRSQ